MDSGILQRLDAREVGRRLQEARRARGKTQQDAAEHLGVARTTVTAIEKGERRIQPTELVRLAAYYGRQVGELVRSGQSVEAFAVQLRATLVPTQATEEEIAGSTWDFQQLCEDYLELEQICEAPLSRQYPALYEIAGVAPEGAAEDVATSERNRLGLGDGPVLNLRELLENDVGLRIFYLELPSRIAGMYAFTDQLGGCIAINQKHPAERRRTTGAHEYGHFLSKRFRSEISVLARYQRIPEQERFANAFASAFLMPATGLRRRFHELERNRSGRVTPADLCILADFYFVSVEALTRRVEDLRLLPVGTWERLHQAGFKVREAQSLLGLAERPVSDHLLPLRYMYLAAEAYDRGELSEGQFARYLRVDRIEARRLAAELANRPVVSDTGEVTSLSLNLGEPLPSRDAERSIGE
jgi:Zn-dependent peptidase ImmA (M78 family)/transcriptional regulator with XRE-family HTH domain